MWKRAGRPSEGSLYERKRDTRRSVQQKVTSCRAKLERSKIQARDLMFNENHNRRFKHPQNRSECRSLLINDQIKTDSTEIASHFKDFL